MQEIGVLTEVPGLYENLGARENLEIYARLYGVDDVAGQAEKYLRLLDIWDRRNEPAGTFSKGMKQKLAIARADVLGARLFGRRTQVRLRRVDEEILAAAGILAVIDFIVLRLGASLFDRETILTRWK